MLSKTIVKYIQSLHHKKYRDEHGVFIAEGPKVLTDILLSKQFFCKMIFASESWFCENEKLLRSISAENKFPLKEFELEKISLLQTPNKVLAVFGKKEFEAGVLKNNVSIMLDDIQDPGNMGTIIRIADWFNIRNIICSENCVDLYNPKVVQASMGSLGRVNVVYADLQKVAESNKDVPIYAATLTGTSIHSINNIKEGFILIGNESRGVSNELLKYSAAEISIPKFGKAESLNAAVAAGIILSHLLSSDL
jgi:TrmH family RNA methyltransferase